MLDNMMPLLGGLCQLQRTWPIGQHDAPHRRTLSRTTDFARWAT
jgi:hypothetical protein